ncbi:Thioredoxin domain-containing protein 5, partial [Cladochytrium tenue]
MLPTPPLSRSPTALLLALLVLLQLLLEIPATCASPAPAPRLSPAEKKRIKAASEEADRDIRHVEHADVASALESGVHVVFFGATWCRYTQRFNPKWLQVQRQYDASTWRAGVKNFGIHKVECSHDEFFCTQNHHTENGYPTINLYVNGQFVEEYMGADDVEPMLHYIDFQITTKAMNSSALEHPESALPYDSGFATPAQHHQHPAAEEAADRAEAAAVEGDDGHVDVAAGEAASIDNSGSAATGAGSGGWSSIAFIMVASAVGVAGFVGYRAFRPRQHYNK